MSVSPNLVQGGSPVYLTGCNYEVEPVEIHVVHPTGTDMWTAGVWYTGCFDAVVPTGEPGLYTIEVYQGGSSRLTMKASSELTGTVA